LQRLKNFKNLGLKFSLKMKKIFNKANKIFSNTGNSKQYPKNNLGPEILGIKVYTAIALHFYMEAKFGPLEKGVKSNDINRDEIFQNNSQTHPFFYNKRNVEILEGLRK